MLRFEEREGHELSTVLVQKSSETNFVAISHIWAEGLGNDQDNDLQYCEVERVFGLIAQLASEGIHPPSSKGQSPVHGPQSRSLWIDTMCVPVEKRDPETGEFNNGELKKLAMQKMRDTYRSASEVLVLDAYVQAFRFQDSSPLEAFARVVSSSWMQRLWTLQEGRLAQRLYFQFADGPVELREIFNSLPVSPFPAKTEKFVSLEITMSYRASRLHTTSEQMELFDVLYEGVIATREAVVSRGLTKDSDEAFCLATLMNLDLKSITDAPIGKTMEKLWDMIRMIPLSLIFSKAPMKLPTLGYHWAPSSFRGAIPQGMPNWRYDDYWAGPDKLWKVAAEKTTSGLLVTLPGLFLLPTKAGDAGWSKAIDMSPNHVFQLPGGRWIGLCLGESWSQLTKDIHPEKCTERMALILQDDGLIRREREACDRSAVIDNDIPSKSFLKGLVARIRGTEGTDIHVAGIQHAQVLEMSADTSVMLSAGVSAAQKLWQHFAAKQPNTKEVTAECIVVVTEALRDSQVHDACRNERVKAGADDRPEKEEEELMYMLAGIAYNVYLGGFNAAEIAPDGCRWVVD